MKKIINNLLSKKTLSILISGFLMGNLAALTGCSKKSIDNSAFSVNVEESNDNESVDKNKDEKEKQTQTKDENKQTQNKNNKKQISQSNTQNESNKTNKTETVIKFNRHPLEKNVKTKFSTQWKNSKDGKISACIEGKGPDGSEEGIGKIYIKDTKTKESWYLQLDQGQKQNSPKIDLEWMDNENIVCIIGQGYGTIELGGNVYKINSKTGEYKVLYDTKNKKKQVVAMKKNNNILELSLLVYEDDEFIESHDEKVNINLGGK